MRRQVKAGKGFGDGHLVSAFPLSAFDLVPDSPALKDAQLLSDILFRYQRFLDRM
jgi:hypothetical protein